MNNKSVPWDELKGERIVSVFPNMYGTYVDVTTESGKEFRIKTGRSGAHNEVWSTVRLLRTD